MPRIKDLLEGGFIAKFKDQYGITRYRLTALGRSEIEASVKTAMNKQGD
jgi:hypothetical protein